MPDTPRARRCSHRREPQLSVARHSGGAARLAPSPRSPTRSHNVSSLHRVVQDWFTAAARTKRTGRRPRARGYRPQEGSGAPGGLPRGGGGALAVSASVRAFACVERGGATTRPSAGFDAYNGRIVAHARRRAAGRFARPRVHGPLVASAQRVSTRRRRVAAVRGAARCDSDRRRRPSRPPGGWRADRGLAARVGRTSRSTRASRRRSSRGAAWPRAASVRHVGW